MFSTIIVQITLLTLCSKWWPGAHTNTTKHITWNISCMHSQWSMSLKMVQQKSCRYVYWLMCKHFCSPCQGLRVLVSRTCPRFELIGHPRRTTLLPWRQRMPRVRRWTTTCCRSSSGKLVGLHRVTSGVRFSFWIKKIRINPPSWEEVFCLLMSIEKKFHTSKCTFSQLKHFSANVTNGQINFNSID